MGSQPKWTPGPWRAVSRNVGIKPTDDVDDDFLGWVIEGPPDAVRGQFGRAADARLIAAAPDMLAALKAMLDPDECEGDVERAMAAIRKAEGRPEP